MATKRTTKKANLTVVQSDSPAAASKKPAGDKGKMSRAEAVAKAQETRRQRAAERRARVEANGGRSNLDLYLAGEYPVGEWTDKEVQMGRPEGANGFSGKVPTLTARQHAEAKRELLRRGQNYIDKMYPVALRVLADVAVNGEKDADRVKAALALAERTAGKVPERIELKSSDPWQDILDEIMTDEVLPKTSTVGAQGD